MYRNSIIDRRTNLLDREYLTKIGFHITPFIPLIFGYYYLTLATCGFILLAYVKVSKLEESIKESKDPAMATRLGNKAKIWQFITFHYRL